MSTDSLAEAPRISEEERKKIADALQRAQVTGACPMCKNNHFTVLEGYISNPLQVKLGIFNLGGASIPTAVIVCDRCGFLSQHALGSLGLLPRGEVK